MAVATENSQSRLLGVVPGLVPSANTQVEKSPIQGSPLVDLSSPSSSQKWQEISELKPGWKRLILIPVSLADARQVQNETKPATDIPAGDAAMKVICQQLHEITGYDALVYEMPLLQNEGPINPNEIKQFVSLTKTIAESGASLDSKFPFSYYIEEKLFDSSEAKDQTPGLVPVHSLARRVQAMINGTVPKSRGVNIFAVVGKSESQALETPAPQVFQNESKGGSTATLNSTINPTIEPGQWVPLGPVNATDTGQN